MFRNGVSRRMVAGQELAGRAGRSPGRGRSPGAGSVVVSIRTSARIVAPTTAAAANRGQPSFWKYVSIADRDRQDDRGRSGTGSERAGPG